MLSLKKWKSDKDIFEIKFLKFFSKWCCQMGMAFKQLIYVLRVCKNLYLMNV